MMQNQSSNNMNYNDMNEINSPFNANDNNNNTNDNNNNTNNNNTPYNPSFNKLDIKNWLISLSQDDVLID